MAETGRREEIEPTPAMIDAGADAVHPLDHNLLDRHEQAEAIWIAMERVRRQSPD